MSTIQTALFVLLRDLLIREEGQDLVEYALVFAMIALGCVTGMDYLAAGVNNVFSSVAVTLTTSTA